MDQLVGMGFEESAARAALDAANGDANTALEVLLGGGASVDHFEGAQEPLHNDMASDSDESTISNSSATRAAGEPGIITSHANPEVGPVLTILLSNYWAQKVLAACDTHLEWAPDWASPQPVQPPQSVLEELAKQCAFLHMGSGRARSDAALVERAIGAEPSSLGHFLSALEPLLPAFQIGVDGENISNVHADNVYGDLVNHIDRMLLGKSIPQPPPIIMVEIGHAIGLRIEKSWYPQRYTNELEPLASAARLALVDIDEKLSRIRRKRLDLRAYKGTDVVEMLRGASLTLRQYEAPEAADTLEMLENRLGSQRNALMDEQEALSDERRKLDRQLRELDPALFERLAIDPVPVYRYEVTGVLISSSEYYVWYDGQWFYVQNNLPSVCSWSTVREACHDQAEILVVYSRAPDADELEPSDALKDFCHNELEGNTSDGEMESATPTPTPVQVPKVESQTESENEALPHT